MFWRFLAAVFFVLPACTPRPVILVAPDIEATREVRVFYGTSRSAHPETRFGDERSQTTSFGSYDVSVPEDHTPGQIEWSSHKQVAEKHFLATAENNYPDARAFRQGLRAEFRNRPLGARTAVVYVHGFNNTFAEGVYRLAQISHDFGFPDVAVHYSWPSAGHPFGYVYDRDSMLFARDGLEALLKEVHAAGAEQILLVGHSMGALLTMEVLRQMAISNAAAMHRMLSGVVLISADIDIDVFRAQALRIGPLPHPFVVMTSTEDKALRLSALITGLRDRVGTLDSPEAISDLNVTLIDTSAFNQNLGHFNAAQSSALILILQRMQGVIQSLSGGAPTRTGLLPGTILVVQNATQIILTPVGGN